MIYKILPSDGVAEKVPCFDVDTVGNLHYRNIEEAYKELKTSYRGVLDFVPILNDILEGIYSISEMMIATLIFTEGLDGYYIECGEWYKAKYLKINNVDIIYLVNDDELLTNLDFKKSEFDGNDGNRYKLKAFKKKR